MEKIRIFSAFHGAGGTTAQFDPKFEIVAISEFHPDAIANAAYHYPNVKNFGDITKIIPEELPDFDLMTFGFSCQSFSKAGHQLGYADPKNGNLFEHSCRIIHAKKPPFILAENVENFMAHDDLKTPLTALQMLSDMGYLVDFHLVGGTDFGMPQIRKRVYIFGVREDSVHLLKTNIREAIDGFRREIEKANYEVLSTDKTNTDSSTSQYERYLAHKSSLESFRRQEVISQQGNKALQDSKQCYSSPENYKSLKNINEGRESETVNVIPYSNTTKGEEKTFRIRLDDVANTFLAHGSFCCAENGGTLVQDHGELRYFSPEEKEQLMGWEPGTTKYGIYNGKVQEVPLTKRYFMIGNGIISNCSKDIINSVL